MKRLLFILLLLPMVLLAQVQETAEVTATVQAELTLTKEADVSFGNISATSSPVLDPKGENHVDVGVNAHEGEFTIGGSNGSSVHVSYGSSYTLGDGTSETITFTPDVDGHESTQSSATDIVSGTNVTLGGTGEYKLWIGGSLGTLTSQATGTYSTNASNGSGDFTLTIEYF